jgi:DNA repair exonuclease SbcCD ATPase subunit
MAHSLPDDDRLRATEAQMRRALGLQDEVQTSSEELKQVPQTATPHRPPRRFVRDGEVPVTIVHRGLDEGAAVNKLEAARQALREQITAREHTEQALHEAQATIRDLQTKLAHERIAKDEALRRLETEAQTIRHAIEAAQDELIRERVARQTAEHDRNQAIAKRDEAEARIREVIGVCDVGPEHVGSGCVRTSAQSRPVPVAKDEQEETGASLSTRTRAARRKQPETANLVTKPGSDDGKARRRGRPPKVVKTESEVVEWWMPGWQEKFS